MIVGGGITGLATAWLLRHGTVEGDSTAGLEVTVLEAGTRLGGKIETRRLDGIPFDVGADAFLARRPEAERLVRRLGLGDRLVAPAAGQVFLWVRGALRPLPAGTVLGVPSDLDAVAESGVLTRRGLARARLEPLLPRRRRRGDVAVGRLVADRFGREVADVLVEPLLGGVYAGRADRLSLEAAAAPVAEAARRHRSLLTGLRAHRSAAVGGDRPVFLTVEGGLGQVVEALAAGAGTVRTRATVTGVTAHDHGGVRLELADGDCLETDEVVLAVPAHAAAPLVAPVVPAAASLLTGIRYASVAVVALAYPREAAQRVPRGSGMLVPRTEGRLVKAATWSSRKWPQYAGADRFLVRASVGRIDDERFSSLDDEALVAAVSGELAEAMGLPRRPVAVHVRRWELALPQYEVGHQQRVRQLRVALQSRAPWLHLAGAAYDGVGLAPCVAQAEQVAARISGG